MSDGNGSIAADDDPHERIAQLEARIDDLAERIERCHKIIVAAKIVIALGAVTLLLLLIGAVRFDPVVMMVGVIALIGGIVVLGTNASTAKQMAADMARAEAQRSGLIDQLEFRVVTGASTERLS
jgi:hypothetical protein